MSDCSNGCNGCHGCPQLGLLDCQSAPDCPTCNNHMMAVVKTDNHEKVAYACIGCKFVFNKETLEKIGEFNTNDETQ